MQQRLAKTTIRTTFYELYYKLKRLHCHSKLFWFTEKKSMSAVPMPYTGTPAPPRADFDASVFYNRETTLKMLRGLAVGFLLVAVCTVIAFGARVAQPVITCA